MYKNVIISCTYCKWNTYKDIIILIWELFILQIHQIMNIETNVEGDTMKEHREADECTITCLASGSSMLYWVPAGPSLTLSPRRKPRRVINVLAASSTDGGGPNSWLDSPAEVKRRLRGGDGGEGRREGETECVSAGQRQVTTTSCKLPVFTWRHKTHLNTHRACCANRTSHTHPDSGYTAPAQPT